MRGADDALGGEQRHLRVVGDQGQAGLVDGYEPWVYVGMRCLRDGTVGVYADWRTGDFSVSDLSRLV